MGHLESPFGLIKAVVNAKIPFIYVMYILNTSIFTWELLRNFMIIRVTSVEYTWLGLEWPLA
jgi:hypothetical protein